MDKMMNSMRLTREKAFIDNLSICTFSAMAIIVVIVYCVVK